MVPFMTGPDGRAPFLASSASFPATPQTNSEEECNEEKEQAKINNNSVGGN